MAGDEHIIEEDVVKISPDLRGFKEKLNADLRRAMSGSDTSVTVKVKFDTEQNPASYLMGLRAKALAEQQKLVRNFNESVQKAELQAYNEEQRLQDKRTKSFEDAMAKRNKALSSTFSAPKIIDFGAEGMRPYTALLGALTALSPALIAVGANAIQASSGIAALGSAGVGSALSLIGYTVSLKGLTSIMALQKTVQAQQWTQAANASTKSIKNTDAELAAQHRVLDTQYDVLKAEKDLHDARVQSARDLVDLRNKVADLQNQEQEDNLSLKEAQANRAKVYRNYFSSALERARADQDVANARRKLADTNLNRREAQSDLADSVKKGVTNADKVVQAREALRQAQERRAEARAAESQKSTAVDTGGNAIKSAQAQLDAQLKQHSPAMRAMFNWLVTNNNLMQQMTNIVEQGTLPALTEFLKLTSVPPKKGGKSTMQFFAEEAADLNREIGKSIVWLGKFTNTPFFRGAFTEMQKNNKASLKTLLQAGETLVTPLLRIMKASSPLLVKFSGEVLTLATWIDKVIEKADKSGSLAKWFADSGIALDHWIGIAKNLSTVIVQIFKLALPTGDSLVTRFEQFTKTLADWSTSTSGQQKIKAFFDFFKNLNYGDLANLLAQAAGMFTAFAGAKWAISNPFWTAMGDIAAHNPKLMADAMGGINRAVVGILEYMAAHPVETGILAGMFAAFKVGKVLGLNIKIPVVDQLRNALVSKFGVLDKFLGGSASTATMNVKAGVVNVYGSGGTGGIGDGGYQLVAFPPTGNGGTSPTNPLFVTLTGPVKTPLPVKPPDGKKDGGFGVGVDAFGPAAIASLAALFGLAVIEKPKAPTAKPKAPVKVPAKVNGSYNFPIPGSPDYPTFSYGSGNGPMPSPFTYGSGNGPVLGPIPSGQDRLKQNLKDSPLSKFLRWLGGHGGGQAPKPGIKPPSVPEVPEIPLVPAALRTSIGLFDDFAASIGKAQGNYGQLTGAIARSAGVLTGNIGQLSDTSGQLEQVGEQLGRIATGNWVAKISTQGYPPVAQQLGALLGAQSALMAGASVGSAAKNIANLLLRKADGGQIHGPGTSTSDSIPTLLSNREWVHPVDAVDYYGPAVMRGIQTKQIPREMFQRRAQGGPVGDRVMPFRVDVSKTLIPATDVGAGGVASGDAGVAETAEATARKLGASTKQLIALMEAGLVESGLRNINYGDRDSVGFLQQRPSQGWGTVAQIMNVAYATTRFIEKAKRVDRAKYTAGQLAQAVQVSAFPDRYDQRYADAVAVLNRSAPYLAGYTGGGGSGGQGAMFGPWPDSAASVHGHDSGIWRKIIALVPRNLNPGRYGSLYDNRRTDNGGWSWHAAGRAVDFAGYNQDALAQFFEARRPSVLELIHRTKKADYGISRGKPHDMGHEYALHQNHLHVAMAKGGQVRARKYDTGGTLPPGYTLAFNGTGRHETVRTAKQEAALSGPLRLDRRDIALLARHIAGAASPTVHMDGRQVAEITNSYTYLPAGV